MSFQALMAASQRLNASVEALAALGAELRLRRDRLEPDPHIRRLIGDAVAAIEPGLLDGLEPAQEAAALGFIRSFFRQAIDLLEDPARPPGWVHEDAVILQSQGQASRLIVGHIDAYSRKRPNLRSALQGPGTFLDVGTGVGWLAIEATKVWPSLRVVGIDPWEPALALARKNVEASGAADRIELRMQGVEALNDRDAFTLAWLAGPFIASNVIVAGLEKIRTALAPGGWLVFGLYAPPPNPLGEALTALRIVRGGGHPWTAPEVEQKLRALGFEEIESFSPQPPFLFVIGRRPA